MPPSLDFRVVVPKGTDIKAGDTVLTCTPWLATVSWASRSTICAFCWKPSKQLRACKNCQYCHYCDEKCQKAHWDEEHRRECSMLAKAVEILRPANSAAHSLFSPSSEFLFLKAMMRFAESGAVPQATFQGPSVLDYFRESHPLLRWDRVVMEHFCNGLLSLHDRLSKTVKKMSCGSDLSRETRLRIAENVILTSEYVFKEFFAGNNGCGTGLYPATNSIPVACQGNCAWVFSGRTYVLKALVDISDFRSIEQLSVSPTAYWHELLTRMEKQRIICLQKYLPDRSHWESADFWPCRCVHCSDGREAELNPMKCVTSSCMEKIPCDDRAQQPCPQCGACNGARLPMAQEESIKLNKNLIALHDIGAIRNIRVACDEKDGKILAENPNYRLDLKAAFKLEKDMEASRLIHPDCMVKNVLLYRISIELDVQQKVLQAWMYRKRCFVSIRTYYGSLSTVDYRYGEFLLSTHWLAQAAKFLPGRCRETCRKLCCRDRALYQKMDLEGRTVLVKLYNIQWNNDQVKKIVDAFRDIIDLYNDFGVLAYRVPGFFS